jgi:RHS repeat-associated protein
LRVPYAWRLAFRGVTGLLLVTAVPAAGQITPQAIGPGVSVTPDGTIQPTRLPNTGDYAVTFSVFNVGNTALNLDVTCIGRVNVVCVSSSASTLSLASGATVPVNITYRVTSVGTGRVVLFATQDGGPSDSGWVKVPVALGAGKPGLVLKNQNGDHLPRGLCLTAGAGEAAGASCGDLVVTHGMPVFRTLGRDRALTLGYNSATVTGSGLVAARVTENAGMPQPDKVVAVLTVGTATDSADFTPIASGTTRQIVMGRGITGLATGVYPMTLLVRNVYGTSLYDTTSTGRLLIVNRAGSEFGRGWSLLGLEQVVSDSTDSTRRVWVTGDGSIRLYHQGVALTAAMLSQAGLGSFSATAAVDGSTGTTAWQTDAATPGAWLQGDLGAQPSGVTTVRVYGSPTQRALYDVEYSDNATAWSKAYVGFRPTDGWSQVTWNSVGGHRYWRLLLTNTPGAGGGVTELSFGSANNFYGAPGTAPDSLVRFDSLGTKWYRRDLRHGAFVKLDETGRHRLTESRLGARTVFTWTTLNGQPRLTSIVVPPNGASGTTYTLAYDVTAGVRLDKITDPGTRMLDATMSGSDLSTLSDPDGKTTGFGYDGVGHLTSRTNRRGFTTTYQYLNGVRLTRVTVPRGLLPGDPETAVTQFLPWDERGLALGSANQTPADTSQARTIIRGPRWSAVPDTAIFWIDRWGSFVRTQDALGGVTTILRSDPAVPAATTQVTFPNGRTGTMSYNLRGSLIQVRDSTNVNIDSLPTHVTTYFYASANAPDSPSAMIDSVRESVGGSVAARTARFVYDSLGITDTVVDQRGHHTSFRKQASGALKGMVTRVSEDTVETWLETAGVNDTAFALESQAHRIGYDALGNIKVDTAATGVVTTYVSDIVGRVADLYDPLGTRRRRAYDSMNRVTGDSLYRDKQVIPFSIDPLNTTTCRTNQVVCVDSTRPYNATLPTFLSTIYKYSPLTLDTVLDPRSVQRRYTYEGRNAVAGEIDDFGVARQAFHGPSGLLDSTLTRSGTVVRFHYDVLGRRTSMVYPANLTYASSQIPGDSVRYTYDLMGNLLTTTNREGTITRTYYGNGLLRQQVTEVSTQRDSISYFYDATGARIRAIHGSGTTRDTTDYRYHPTKGTLDSMIVRLGAPANTTRAFAFIWDGLGRRRQISYPTEPTTRMTVRYRYDAAGVLRRLVALHPGGPTADVFDDTLRVTAVDAVGRILTQKLLCRNGITIGNPCTSNITTLTTKNAYNRLSMLIGQAQNTTIDSMRYDASGNMTYRLQGSNPAHVFTIASQHNRIESDSTVNDANKLNFSYTAEQSRDAETPVNANDSRQRHYYYDRLNRLSGTWTIVGGQTRDHPLDCHYDPAGQMAAACDNAPWLAFDGPNPSAVLMNGGAEGWRFFHAPGVDEPLMGYYRQTGNYRVLYYVTDGAGRQLAVADSSGQLQSQDNASGRDGWRYAGGTANGTTFAADRFANPNVSGLSFFRNRAYDQASGRWTQEDPVGLAGGLNLYLFNGNNPVSNTDPFGLKVCFKGDGASDNIGATEQVIDADIDTDKDGCVTSGSQVHPRGKKLSMRAKMFIMLAESADVYNVVDGASPCAANPGEHHSMFCPGEGGGTVYVNVSDIGRSLGADGFGCSLIGRLGGAVSMGRDHILAHELLGHAFQNGLIMSEVPAYAVENQYRQDQGGRGRCRPFWEE